MVNVNVLASGSKGNCTALIFGKVTILLDAGIGFDRLQQALNFENPAACLITHEHGDHVNKNTLNELLTRGVEVYMTKGTANALQLEPSHRLKIIESKIAYDLDNKNHIWFYATPSVHDAAEPVYFTIHFSTETVSYITDTNYLPTFDTLPRYLIIEANHSTADLINAPIDQRQKQRILNNHLAIEKVLPYIETNLSNQLTEVHLIHISKRHGDAEKFKQMVQAVVSDKVKAFAHWEGKAA